MTILDGVTTRATVMTILAIQSATAITTTTMAVRTLAAGQVPAMTSMKPTRVIAMMIDGRSGTVIRPTSIGATPSRGT